MIGRPTIVLAADAGFAMQLAAALHSLVQASTTPSSFIVFHHGYDRALIERVTPPAPEHDFDWVPYEDRSLGGLRVPPAFPKATLLRLLLPDWLPSQDRVVYFDADAIALGDPADLWDVALDGAPLAAVRSPTWAWAGSPLNPFPAEALDVPPSQPYFNAGILLLDLARWRADGLSRRCLDLLRVETYVDPDQTAINAVAGGDCLPLDPTWNVMAGHYDARRSFAPVFEDPEVLGAALERPRVLHFNRGTPLRRPWQGACCHPKRDRWYEAVDLTPWAGWRPPRVDREVVAGVRRRLGTVVDVALHGR